MKRSKMNGLIISVTVLLFVICSFWSWMAARQTMIQNFDYITALQLETVGMRIRTACAEDMNTDEMLQYASASDHKYPSRLFIIDEEGRILKKSESSLEIYYECGATKPDGSIVEKEEGESQIIPIGKYLDTAFKKSFEKYKDDYVLMNYNALWSMDYNIHDGELVPIAFDLMRRGYTSENHLVIRLSEEEAAYQFKALDDTGLYLWLDDEAYDYKLNGTSGPEMTGKMCRAAEGTLGDSDLYEGIRQTIKEGSIGELWSSAIQNENRYSLWKVCIDGKDYCLLLWNGQNLSYATFHSHQFRIVFFMLLLDFSVILFWILFFANRMYTKNQKLDHARKAFTNAVAHELKTPIAIIQNQSECILEEVAPDKTFFYASSIHGEARRMNGLVMRFLQYSRLTSMEKIEKKEENLSEILWKEVNKYLPLMEDVDLCVSTEIENEISFQCNAELMALAMDNLLGNALKYAGRRDEKEPLVRILLKKKGRKGFNLFVYNDTAEQIADTDAIWNLMGYTHGDKREGNSTGMGLPVTAEILKLHDLAYRCHNTADGVCFVISN